MCASVAGATPRLRGQHRLLCRRRVTDLPRCRVRRCEGRLTIALGIVDGVQINCVSPHTVATDAVLHALQTRTLAEIAPPPATLLQLEEVVAGVARVVEDDSLFGRVLALRGGEPPRFM